MTINLVGPTANLGDPLVAKGDVGIGVEALEELLGHEGAAGQGKSKGLIEHVGSGAAHAFDASQGGAGVKARGAAWGTPCLESPGCSAPANDYAPNDPYVVGHEPNCQAVSVCAYWSAEKARFRGPFPAVGE